MKRTIRLNEADIHRIVKESVKRVLKENQHFNHEGFTTKVDGLESFYGVYDEWLPKIELWEDAGNSYADFHNDMENICSDYAKKGYSQTANIIKKLMDEIDDIIGKFGSVREYFDHEDFKKRNNGQSYGDYLYSAGKSNYGG